VASLARTFGGRASVVSAPGEGSTFTIELPLAPAGTGSAPGAPSADPSPAPGLPDLGTIHR
jgi:hypothetical protein